MRLCHGGEVHLEHRPDQPANEAARLCHPEIGYFGILICFYPHLSLCLLILEGGRNISVRDTLMGYLLYLLQPGIKPIT